ncbi:siroheme synthase CysG [Aestuariirhabdus litorea]|uniref:Siroheme synthase n=1 Tax=Aestuariirhabdus litorea TaxID=2528527 RepID=A0A3P3VPX5_9GAMM|nr:siroheme synthase CysG [Aestuariirhabdus litorea]RRJ84785.1 uroporphyrinogen-III C-methyltransferase [Aestuariirhabdus litorea]RWW98009.1 uroporphyrinogen-III C-methyltransferase [Endozoicomonadaceae bacterium GTF-13]
MEFLPLYFDLKNKDCLVVGGGEVAFRKASLLLKAGARIFIVAPEIGAGVTGLEDNPCVSIERAAYSPDHLEGKVLVIAATNDHSVNLSVSEHAKARNMPVNVVDNPPLCSFILPAIIDRSPIVVAVSSGGKSPVLARLLRSRLESTIPAAYGRLAELVGGFREAVKQRFSSINQRRNFWESVLQGRVAELVFAGKEVEAARQLQALIESSPKEAPAVGEVYLVGGGPGDPDLLTFRALRLMQQADVVLYDRLVSEAVLDMTRRDAERINVGKARSLHTLPQEEINDLLVRLAREGHRVLRLKGGDPFVFGRGGEEIDKLAENGIPFQVVPGITAATGCSCYAGIPLTHRDYAQSVRFITGHLKDGSCKLPWAELVQSGQTVVFYMGLIGLPIICEQLVAHGRSADTPVALIQQGTTRNQRVYTGTLKTIVGIIAAEEVKAPTLIIVGEVVSLREKLGWRDDSRTLSAAAP